MTDDSDFSALQDALAGHWSLERELGRGGMGTVYLARDVALDRPVAIKVLHTALAGDPVPRERFVREAQTGARLVHPHIVPIYAVDEAAGRVFFVMGLVDGESVGERIRREGPLPPADAERILREIGWALAHAHAHGVLHRDVTVDNILLERRTGRAMLADFGIAAPIDGTTDGPLLGTPAYLAPELVEGAPAGVAGDLYALGVAGWTMLAGRFPYNGATSADVLLAHVGAPIPSLARAAPATPSRVVRTIEACLAKAPAERPATMEAFLAGLGDDRRALPAVAPALERWLTRGARIRPLWAFGTTMVGMLTMTAFTVLRLTGAVPSGAAPSTLPELVLQTSLLFFGAIVLTHGLHQLRELRIVLRAGYVPEDLRLASAARAVELSLDRPAQALLPGRLLRGLLLASVLCFVSGPLLLRLAVDLGGGSGWEAQRQLIQLIADIMRWSWVVLWTILGAAFIVPLKAPRPDRGFARAARFWGSRLGAGFARLAATGLPRSDAPMHTLHRPTELVLDLAIEDLWDALPDPARAAFAGLPVVARCLRHRVAELRALGALLDAPTLRRSPEATALRERLAEREGDGLAALERLRLLLVRVGAAHAPAGEFTRALDDARALELELVRELGVHASLRTHLTRGARPATFQPSPAPTPT